MGGSVLLAGAIESEGFREDGTHYLGRDSVTFSDITFDATVDRQGQVTGGTMTVDTRWSGDDTGTSPSILTPYHVTSDHRLSGTLPMGGTAARLVAAGTLSSEKVVHDSDGNLIEEVSGEEPLDVEWAFTPSEGDCGMATGRLVEATGGLMASSLIPRFVFEDESELSNELVTVFRMWPAGAEVDVEDIAQRVEQLNEVANATLADPAPTPAELLLLVEAVEALREELAQLEECQAVESGFLAPSSGEDWLAAIVQSLLFKALENPGDFSAQELILLLNIGVRGGAVVALDSDAQAAELYEAFGDALGQALDVAIASSDLDTVADIAAASGSYGYSDIYDKAMAALAEES